ncbi:hypothetical protein ACHAQH_005170 [Verticillium albo-atrum]
MGSSALPTRRVEGRQALPLTGYQVSEQQFANDGPAWSSLSWPEEYGFPDPESDPDNALRGDEAGPDYSRGRTVSAHKIPVNSSPEPGKAFEDLSYAMLTVDNGFEGQWWYQGKRHFLGRQLESGEIFTPPVHFNPDPLSSTSLLSSLMEVRTPAYIIARCSVTASYDPVPSHYGSIVSPVSTTTSPWPDSPRSIMRLQRTTSTRSDELFTLI